jgi:hypothetical protein
MGAVFTTVGVVLASLLALSLSSRLWRWRCPSCRRRRLRFVGLASEWSAGWVESRFPEGQCGACGRWAVCRAGLLGRWEPARQAEQCVAPDPGRR